MQIKGVHLDRKEQDVTPPSKLETAHADFRRYFRETSALFNGTNAIPLLSVSVHEFINEPREQFYQDVDRGEAETMLENKQNGTFIIRPSASTNGLGTLSIIQDNRIFHLNMRQREDDTIALGTERINEKYFTDVNALINYHISNYLILYSDGETYRTLLIPFRG